LFLLGALVLLIGAGWTNALQVFAAAITLGVLQRLAPWLERRQLRRLSAQMPGTALPQIVEFSDAGVEFTNGPRTARLGWDAILEVEERNEFFLMFVAKHWAHYLPKRAIGGDPKETELRGMLSSKLGQRYSLSS
jgi:hypothetical protein